MASVVDSVDKGSKRRNVPGSRVQIKSQHFQEIKAILLDPKAPQNVRWLQECLESRDGFHQVNLIKKIGFSLQKTHDHANLSIRVLTEIYLQTDCRHIMKRAVASALQAIPTAYHATVVKDLQEGFLDNIFITVKQNQNVDIQRHQVENVISCLENFNLGAKCIAGIVVSVLDFLRLTLGFFSSQFENATCPTGAAKASLDCQTTIRAIIAVLQKMPLAVDQKCQSGVRKESDELLTSLRNHVDLITQLLTNSAFSLDCRCSCGIALTLLLSIPKNHNYRLEKLIYALVCDDESGSRCILLSNESKNLLNSQLPPISKLCLFMGVLSIAGTDVLISDIEDGKTLLFHMILPVIMSSTKDERESSVTVVSSRAVFLWTKRAKESLKEKPGDSSLCNKLKGDGEILCSLLEYVWTHWEHFIDCIRHTTRDIFDNIVTLHILSSGEVPSKSQFVIWLTDTLLKMPWDRRGKYGVLCTLVKHVGAKKMLELRPNLIDDLISSMKDSSLLSHALELLEALFLSHKSETREDSDECNRQWVLPIIVLSSEMEVAFQVEHILTKLFKCSPSSLTFIVSELVELESKCPGKTSHLRALLLTAKTARHLGLVKQFPSKGGVENYLSWNEFTDLFPTELLKLALSHVDDEIRLDALALLCDSPKTTEIIPSIDLDLICAFLPYNMANQSPAFRQKLLALLKKLLFRINDGGLSLRRQLEQSQKFDMDAAEAQPLSKTIKLYQDFLRWLSVMLFENLYPGANFPRRGMALNIIKLINDIVGFNSERISDSQNEIKPYLETYHIQTLLECLKDTYETNKTISLNILMSLSTKQLGFHHRRRLTDVFDASFRLASVAKPTGFVTAAYLFRLMVQHPLTAEVSKSMLEVINDSGGRDVVLPKYKANQDDDVVNSYIVFAVLDVLTFQLAIQLEMARTDLLEAVDHAPMYGLLFSIRSLIEDLDLYTLVDDQWRKFFAKIILICLDIGKIVSPIVNNASPEGHLTNSANQADVEELDSEFKKIIGASEGYENVPIVKANDSSVRSWAMMAQKLVLCGWRTIKEVALLLGDICQRSIEVMHKQRIDAGEGKESVDGLEIGWSLVDVDSILLIGDFFITLLAETKHRGAFEQAYVGFCKVCDGLWRNSIGALHQLPTRWLRDLLEHVESGSGRSALCSTRRSAGLPFMVQALVSSEPNIKGASCFKLAMQCLLQMALSVTSTSDTKVHTFNILRALYRDTRLGDDVIPFIADGLQAAILGFKGKTWGIRNSATLLFSTLITRIFGVMRGKDELSRKNCMTGSVFFHRSPSLFKFFTDELMEATLDMDDARVWTSASQQPSLYPMLMILARLYPSGIEGAQSSLKLSVFIPYVMKCGKSPILNTRILAAKALVPLVSFMDVLTILSELFESLPSSSRDLYLLGQNALHGTLLQIHYLLTKNVSLSSETFTLDKNRKRLFDLMNDKLWISSGNNSCPVTRACFFDILAASLDMKIWNSRDIIGENILRIVDAELSGPDTPSEGLPGAAGLQMSCSKMAIRLNTMQINNGDGKESFAALKRIINRLLRHMAYEVRLTTLGFLLSLFSQRLDDKEFADLLFPEPSVPVGEWSFLKKLDGDWIARFAESDELAAVLISMAIVSEEHPDCLIQLHHLLPLLTKTLDQPWINVATKTPLRTSSEKLELILLKGECEPRDDVRSAFLHFTGFLIPKVYDEIIQTRSTGNSNTVPNLVMTEWIEAFSLCCSPEQSFRVRLTATTILVQNRHILLLDPHKSLGFSCLTVWSAAIQLFQDDDCIIRQLASKLLDTCLLKDFSESCFVVQPALAIDVFIGQFVEHFGKNAQSECLTTLLDWMLKQEVQETRYQLFEDEQKMFDKGKLNVYAEEMNFTMILRKHFKNLLRNIAGTKAEHGQPDKKDGCDIRDYMLTWFDRCHLTLDNMNRQMEMSSTLKKTEQPHDDFSIIDGNLFLQNFIDMIVEELSLILRDIDVITDSTSFLSRSFDLIIVRLYRLVTTVHCLCKYQKGQMGTLRKILIEMQTKFGNLRFSNQVVHSFVTDMRQLCLLNP